MNDVNTIHRDISFLAGSLPHRGSVTDQERAAAEYIHERMARHSGQAQIDDFYAPESAFMLIASYYGDFCVVALIAVFAPLIAFVYGLTIFLAYMAEITSYPAFSRLLPHYETQNVVGRFLGLRPKRQIVVMAHYDTARQSPLGRPSLQGLIRPFHFVLVFAMVIVLASCVATYLEVGGEVAVTFGHSVRWVAVALLAFTAVFLLYSDSQADYVRGANGNASGVAALLQVAERLHVSPIEDVDIYLVATGSKEVWLNGMQHFLRQHKLDKRSTVFINLERVGETHLHYVEAEGLLQLFGPDKATRRIAEEVSAEFGATPHSQYGLPTDALVPLARGYQAITVTTTNDQGQSSEWRQYSDNLLHIDEGMVERSSEFALSLIKAYARQ